MTAAFATLALLFSAAQSTPVPDLTEAEKLAAVEWELSLTRERLGGFACEIENIACLNHELVERYMADQWIRHRITTVCGALERSGEVAQCRQRLGKRMLQLDQENLDFLTRILEAHGWPVGSGWGPMAEKGAWAITQHALPSVEPDPRLQALPHVAEAVKAGRLTQWHYDVMKTRSEAYAREE